jgi:hypothetical protein
MSFRPNGMRAGIYINKESVERSRDTGEDRNKKKKMGEGNNKKLFENIFYFVKLLIVGHEYIMYENISSFFFSSLKGKSFPLAKNNYFLINIEYIYAWNILRNLENKRYSN